MLDVLSRVVVETRSRLEMIQPAEAVLPLKRGNKGRRLGAPSRAEEKTVQLHLTQ